MLARPWESVSFVVVGEAGVLDEGGQVRGRRPFCAVHARPGKPWAWTGSGVSGIGDVPGCPEVGGLGLGGEVEPDGGTELAGAAQAGPLGAATPVGEFGDDAQAPPADFEVVNAIGEGKRTAQEMLDQGGPGTGVDHFGPDRQAVVVQEA